MADETLNSTIEIRGARIDADAFPPGSPWPFVEAVISGTQNVEIVAEKASQAASGAYIAQVGIDELKVDVASISGMVSSLEGDVKSIEDSTSTLPLFEGVYDVFIIYGQSNAVGFAGADSGFSPVDLVALNEKSLYWDGSSVMPATHYMTHASGDVSTGSAWDQFANTYIERTGRGVVLIPCAKAGVPISELQKGGVYYANMKSYVDGFYSKIPELEFQIGDKYIVFHHGEQDQLLNTSREIYQDQLSSLIDDSIGDFSLRKFYVFMVGCPITRQQSTWQQIQNAQSFIANTKKSAEMASLSCPSFNRSNLLLGSDGTHYSISGYNLMGDSGASFIAIDIKNKTRITVASEERYSKESLIGQNPWDRIAATLSMVLSGGVYSLTVNTSNNTSNLYRSSNITGVSYDSSINAYLINCSTKISSLINMSAHANDVGVSNGVHASISRYNETTLRLDLYMDFDFFINMATGQILGLDAGIAPTWVASNVSASISGDTATITHAPTKFFPLVSAASNPTLTNTPGTFTSRRTSETQFLVKTISAAYNVVMVRMKRVKIKANTAQIPGLEISINCTSSQY